MKTFGINGQLRKKLFLIVIPCFPLVKADMKAQSIHKLCNGVDKTPVFLLFFNCQRRKKDHCTCTLVNCGGVSFWSLDMHIYNCKFRNEKKYLSKCSMNIHSRHLNCCIICNLKTSRCSNTLKGSQRMGGGRIFLKAFHNTLFNDNLLNDPNFSRIHLPGQYL